MFQDHVHSQNAPEEVEPPVVAPMPPFMTEKVPVCVFFFFFTCSWFWVFIGFYRRFIGFYECFFIVYYYYYYYYYFVCCFVFFVKVCYFVVVVLLNLCYFVFFKVCFQGFSGDF